MYIGFYMLSIVSLSSAKAFIYVFSLTRGAPYLENVGYYG
jgi:hypothetical protein